ncbi:helicase-related protein [Actinomadura sp. ATCC 39365]
MTKEIVLLVLGALLAEGTEVAPWLAKRLVRWSAYIRHLDRRRAEVRAEEWEAIIESRPGKLFKLATSLLFALRAGAAWGSRLRIWIQLHRQVKRDLDHRHPDSSARAIFEAAAKGEHLVIWAKTGSGRTVALASHLIETGIDIRDVETLITVLPPLDSSSWVQASSRVGRCHRSSND